MNADVIVIGTGQAGVPLASRLAGTKKVLIVERGELGGTCVNVGCTPTKTMVASARAAHVARNAARLGVHTGEVRVDFPAIIARKNAIVKRWRAGVEKRLKNSGENLTTVHGHARFVGPNDIEVNGERHSAAVIVINVGARPVVPQVPGLGTVPFLDNHRLMDLTALPEHLVVMGGGYIGCEFGQMFRRFGAKVTIIDSNDHLLSREDADTSASLEEAFRAEGIELALGSKVDSVRKTESGGVAVKLAGGKEVTGSHLLVAVGRRPNTDDLGCDAAGITLDAHGFVVVDDGYATNVPNVYAVGDATPGPQFTHTSWDDHRILFDRLTAGGTRGRKDRIIPFTVFTDPHVAGVGLSEKEARANGVPFEMATMPYGDIARAIEIDETIGTMKILVDPKTDRLVGVRLVGAEAGELVHVFVALMAANASVRALVDAECAHPTFAEGMQSLVMRLPKFKLE